jgi:tRNA threonylcarbamoyl adenosine modification protein (Sua5/YciO/YrdC/YwlC family)
VVEDPRHRGLTVATLLEVHPVTPQTRLIEQAVRVLRAGGVIAYPTDTTYALGAAIGEKAALDRICRIRRIDNRHDFTLMCRDLSQTGQFARYTTPGYRLIKAHTPGPYTFLVRASREVPRRLQHPKKKTIGLRVPDHAIAQALLEAHGEPLLTTTLRLPGDEFALNDPLEIRDRLDHEVEIVIDGGVCSLDPTSVIDLTGDEPVVLREAMGDVSAFR